MVFDAFFATFFLVGLQSAVFGLIPLRFLKGHDIWQWKRKIWVAVFAPIAVIFINLRLAVSEPTQLSLVVMIKALVLFIVFGIFSVAFWGYFRVREKHLASRPL